MDNLIGVKDIMDNLIGAKDRKEKALFDQDSNISTIDDLWERIRKESLFIYPYISNRCNLNCQVCFARTPDGKFDFSDMRVEDIKYILKRIGRNKKVCFAGGEPTLNEDLFEFIRLTKDSGNIPVLNTNGIRLANFDYTKKLVQSGLEKVYLSIDGLTSWVTQYLDGNEEHLGYKLKALENLKKFNTIKVFLSCRIARGINEGQIKDILDFAIVNNELIKGVLFCAATIVGWFNIPEFCALSRYDLIPLVEKCTKGNLSQRYFYEFTTLRQNLDSLLHKVDKHFPCEETSVFASIDNRGALRELISTRELRAINKHLKDKKYYRLLKYLFRYKGLLGMYRRVLKPATIEFEFYKRSGLQIELHEAKCVEKENLEIMPLVKRRGRIFTIFGMDVVPR